MPYKDPEKQREYDRKKYHRKRDKILETKRKWYEKNKENINLKRRSNSEKEKERRKKYYERNKEKIKLKSKEYKKNNKEAYNKWERNRRKNDALYRVKKNLRKRIQLMLKSKNSIKTSGTFNILGIDKKGFIKHLESLWEPWMNWDNYGLYKTDTFNYGWDIDHIVPSSTAITEEDIYRLNHYTNLRPLCSKVNRDIKRDLNSGKFIPI